MTSRREVTWTSGLIPEIATDVATQIVSHVSDFAVIVSPTGTVTAARCSPNMAGAVDMMQWDGLQIQQTLTVESIPKFESRIADFLANKADVLPVELNHKATVNSTELPVRYTFHNLGSGSDLLMLGTDLRRTAEMQQQLVAAQLALEADYEAQREHDVRLRVLMESSDVATAFISVTTGQIVSCNSAAELLLGQSRDALIDAPFAEHFEMRGRKDVVDQLVTAATEQSEADVIAKGIKGNRRLALAPTLFRGSASQMLLCKIKPSGSQVTSSDQLQTQLSELFQNGVDAFVFVTATGLIVSANEAFLKVANVTHSQTLKSRTMTDFLARGAVDLNVMIENAKRSGGMRLYATKIISEHGGERPVEISTTQLKAGADPVFAMVVRDSHRIETANTRGKQIMDVDMNSVVELIGGQSLKDIVAKTTDVVEKICIETAVEMTSNNRVAAAEMLGLSRQSLYVKLRKYGLVSKS
ncbi:MAG: transcriptional regulator PpsR [Tateyamaria sp.]|jgi:transcriptional regulator PpsR|uniref:transcriptional regulator PpsR n=1 Tax=Tateyamaria sp. TaxID=1929288 RepID=UPI0032DE1A51